MNTFDSIVSDVFDRGIEERLDLDTERATIARAQAGDEAAKLDLVRAYAPALRNGVAAYTRSLPQRPQTADLEDVRNQALLGFFEALAAFDLEKHERLAATVPGYVRNAVSSAAGSASALTIKERTLKRFFGILRTAEHDVTEAERIAPDYGMTRETFRAVLVALRGVVSLDSATNDPGRWSGGFSGQGEGSDDLGSRTVAEPLWDGSHADADDRILVEMALSALDTFEKDVVGLAYGFLDADPEPDAEIAHRLGFSRPKIQRVRSGALVKMRTKLAVA